MWLISCSFDFALLFFIYIYFVAVIKKKKFSYFYGKYLWVGISNHIKEYGNCQHTLKDGCHGNSLLASDYANLGLKKKKKLVTFQGSLKTTFLLAN